MYLYHQTQPTKTNVLVYKKTNHLNIRKTKSTLYFTKYHEWKY